MIPISPSRFGHRRPSRGVPCSVLLSVALIAVGPVAGNDDLGSLDHEADITILAGEVARLTQLDPVLHSIPQLDQRLFAHSAVASALTEFMTLPSLRMIDQLADLAQLVPPLALGRAELRPGSLDLLVLSPAGECEPSLRERMQALPSLSPAGALQFDATPEGCRMRWQIADPETAEPSTSALAALPAAPHASPETRSNAEQAHPGRCGARELDAALQHFWRAIELRLLSDVQLERRTYVAKALAAIDSQLTVAPTVDHAPLLALAVDVGAREVQIDAIGDDPSDALRPASFHRRIVASAGLPSTVALLESVIGHRHAPGAPGDIVVLPWINRGLSSVQLVRAEDGGKPALTIALRHFQPDWETPARRDDERCWPDVEPGDGSLDGLSAATRDRIAELMQRFPGPVDPLPDAGLPAARPARQVDRDPFR